MEGKIPFSDFAKLELKIGKILEVEDHPNADKLLVLKVELGEEKPRTIIAGLKNFYSHQDLKDKQAVFITNLEPVTLRGVESNGMILAASSNDKSKVVFLMPEKDINPGSDIS